MAYVDAADGEDDDVVAALYALGMDKTSFRAGTSFAVGPLVAEGTWASWALTERK